MIDLRKYTGSLVTQNAKDLYKDAVNDCAWIRHMQQITKNGNGLLQDNYSHRAAADAFQHALPLELAKHIEERGKYVDMEYIANDDTQTIQLLNMLLEYATAKSPDDSNAIAKRIANQLYKNFCNYAIPSLEKDINELYEEYYESGQYSKDIAEDDEYDMHRAMNDNVMMEA